MRHRKAGRKFSRTADHRKAMFRNMARSLFTYEHIKTTEGYRVSLRRRKMIEEAFGWVKDIGTLRRLMARGLDKIRAHALLNFAAYNLTRLGNLLAS